MAEVLTLYQVKHNCLYKILSCPSHLNYKEDGVKDIVGGLIVFHLPDNGRDLSKGSAIMLNRVHSGRHPGFINCVEQNLHDATFELVLDMSGI